MKNLENQEKIVYKYRRFETGSSDKDSATVSVKPEITDAFDVPEDPRKGSVVRRGVAVATSKYDDDKHAIKTTKSKSHDAETEKVGEEFADVESEEADGVNGSWTEANYDDFRKEL